MDPKVSKKTQDTLGKIIKKPPLTDKLLGKPPFRFLHDIMTSVIKTTGFMQGLFTDTEMNSENVKDKDAKIAFLQKVIDMVSTVTGKVISAKPVKIVAGHEPERTNEFLQALADAINKNVDNDEYVRRVLKGGKGGGTAKEEKKEDKKEKVRSEEKRKGHDSEDKIVNEKDERRQSIDRGDQEGDRKHERDREKDRHKEKRHDRDREKDRHGDKKLDREGEKDQDRHKDRDRESKARDKSKDSREERHREAGKDKDRHKDREREPKSRDKSRESREERHRDKDAEKSNKRDLSLDKENESPDREKVNGEMEEPPTRLQRPASAKGSRRRREGQMNGDDQGGLNEDDDEVPRSREPMLGEGDLPPQVVAARQLARPSSARPAPPRPKQETLESEPAMRLGAGHPTNVIADNDDADDDDDDNFLVQETAPPPPEPDLTPLKPTEEQDTVHGALVKKMLESKKEVERGNQGPGKKTEIERPLISDAQRRKQRESVQKEVDKLRASIQSLTRSANPLGKVMDYVQEDLDSMQQELDKWKLENTQHALDLKREMNVTDRAIDPLRQQLAEIDRAISDQLDRIATVKSNIIRNDQKIQKMLRGISSS